MVGLVVIVVIVIVLASGAIMLGNSGNNDENGMLHVSTWKGEYHVGDFVEYYFNSTSGNAILNDTIVSILATEIEIVSSLDYSDVSSADDQDNNWMAPKDASFAFNRGPNFNINSGEIKLFKFIENETLSTNLGSFPCQHFDRIDTSGGTYDCWTFNGVVVKLINSPSDGLFLTYMLRNSNLEEIVGS